MLGDVKYRHMNNAKEVVGEQQKYTHIKNRTARNSHSVKKGVYTPHILRLDFELNPNNE